MLVSHMLRRKALNELQKHARIMRQKDTRVHTAAKKERHLACFFDAIIKKALDPPEPDRRVQKIVREKPLLTRLEANDDIEIQILLFVFQPADLLHVITNNGTHPDASESWRILMNEKEIPFVFTLHTIIVILRMLASNSTLTLLSSPVNQRLSVENVKRVTFRFFQQ